MISASHSTVGAPGGVLMTNVIAIVQRFTVRTWPMVGRLSSCQKAQSLWQSLDRETSI